MVKNLYTYIMEYAGGTYISQVRGEDIMDSARKWVDGLDVDKIDKAGPEFLQETREIIYNNKEY